MTAVISGLVAVVLLVLLVVALGMRSMNRRESALSAERIKAMAENKGPKPRRPAEETFFESFPKGFDAFEEPERNAPKPRPAAPRPGGRQAAQRGGKQAAAARGKRGVDEWGGPDDYDDDYWSRVRADDGGFGGTIAARMATPRPVDETDGAAGPAPQASDPDAVTVQAPLPTRPVPGGRADASDASRPSAPVSASALADQKTVTFSAPAAFSAPTPDALDAASPAGSASTGPFDASAGGRSAGSRASAAIDPFATGAASRPAESTGPRSGRSRSSRAAARRAAAEAAQGAQGPQSGQGTQSGASFAPSTSTGPFDASRNAGSRGTPVADPLGLSASTGPMPVSSGADPSGATGPFGAPAAYEAPAGTGPFPSSGGAGGYDSRSAAYDPSSSPIPETGVFALGSYDSGRTSGAFEAASPGDALSSPAEPASPATGGSFDPWTAYESPRAGSQDPFGASTDPFGASPTPSYPAQATPAGADATGAADPGWPATGSYPPVPAASSWPAAPRDVLDDPEPPRGASSWPNAETYQTPAYEGYTPGHSPAPTSSPSYEVSTGWATIDASDTVNGSTPGNASPYESAGYDAPSGQSRYGHDQQQGYGGAQPSWPEQNTGGSWPAYDELYDDSSSAQTGGGRRGSHRNPDTDYPDYYR